MMSVPSLQSDPTPIRACTISRDVQKFDLLIEDMEVELGESWGDLSFDDALPFLDQPDGERLEFVVLAVDGEDEADLTVVTKIIRAAKSKGIKVMLIADQVSPVALHQLLRLGADDFVPYPLPDNALHEAIERLRKPVAATAQVNTDDPAAPRNTVRTGTGGSRNGVILPAHGMSGGVGASTFAVNLAWELALAGKSDDMRVCLMDLDFQYGAVSTYLDLPRKENIFEFLSDIENADGEAFRNTLQTFNEHLFVFTAPADMLPLDFVSPADISRLMDFATSQFDFVVVDMPSTVVAWTETMLTRANLYFAIMELDLRSAQNILRLVRALKAEGLPHEKLRYILNRAPKFTDLTAKSRVKRMCESLDISVEVQLPDGTIQVTQANDHGLPLAENAAKNPLRKEIAKLAKSLYDVNKKVETGRRA